MSTEKKKPTKTEAKKLIESIDAFETTYAEEIAARVSAGLPREDAIEVQRRQVAEDTAS